LANKKKNIQNNKKKFDLSKAIPWVAAIGLLVTIELIVVYFNANFVENAAPSFCAINSTIDCDAVAKTNFALLFGVPNAIWGFLFYAFVLVLYFAKSLKEIKVFKFLEVFRHPKSYIFLMSLAIFIADIILGFISTSVIKKICIMCFVTYFLNFILLIVAKPSKSFVDMIITTIDDFMKAITNRIYAVAFFLVVAAGISALFYFDNSQILAPDENVFSNDIETFEPTETSNNLGADKPKVIINEFTDIQCPFCAMSNIIVNKIVADFKNVKVIHHDFPLDKACNPLLKDRNQVHENSCLYSQYAIAAKKQNKSWGLINLMFKNNTDLSEDKILELAKTLDMDVNKLKKDAHSKEVKQELADEIDLIINMGIVATPTYMINGKKHEGILKYPVMAGIVKTLGGVKK